MFIIKIVYAEKLISLAFCFVNIYLHFFSDSKIRNEDYNNKKDKKDQKLKEINAIVVMVNQKQWNSLVLTRQE